MWSVHYNLTNYHLKNMYTKFDNMYNINYYREFSLTFNYKV